ncbi:hypothetical protein V6N13_051649 [Hibiscus sabdariffa]
MQDDHELGPGIDLSQNPPSQNFISKKWTIKVSWPYRLGPIGTPCDTLLCQICLKISPKSSWNYYRCTSAGGLVHDHDMPVPKKRHGPSALIAVAAPVNNLQLTVAYGVQKQAIPSGQWV